MSDLRHIKTYNDATLSGDPVIVKFDNITYCYAKFYPTVSGAVGESVDTFTDNVTGYADSALSGTPVAVQIASGGKSYYLKGYEAIAVETEAQAGIIPAVKGHYSAYLYGAVRIGVIMINNTPYYAKLYPYMVSSSIYDMGTATKNYDNEYVSIIYSPTVGNFPRMTISGELEDSDFGPSDFAAAGHNHDGVYDASGEAVAQVQAHEAGYNHADIAHGETAYGWGNHASVGYAAASHAHLGYINHSLATAAGDFLVASGNGVFAKQTLAQVKATLGRGTATYAINCTKTTSTSSSSDIATYIVSQVTQTGTYVINAAVMGHAVNGTIHASLRTGSTAVYANSTQRTYAESSTSSFATVPTSIILSLTAGNYIFLYAAALAASGTRDIYGDNTLPNSTYFNYHRID